MRMAKGNTDMVQPPPALALQVAIIEDSTNALDARVVVDVPRLCHADYRMYQYVAVDVLRRALNELNVRPVHRIACLEGHDGRARLPAHLAVVLANGLRRMAHRRVVVMRR